MIIVSGKDSSPVQVLAEAKKLGLDADKFILDRTICVPGFTVERYTKLRQSHLTIFSMNCWAGIVYNMFGLPFYSPTINMFTSDDEFIRFARDLKGYISQPLKFVEMHSQYNYPVTQLGDVTWYMNHYKTFDDANEKWRQRAARINWSNVVAVMYTEKPEVLAEFDRLPLEKKVCYTTFETALKSGYYIEPRFVRGREFWRPVIDMAKNILVCYDIWDILLNGKKTPL